MQETYNKKVSIIGMGAVGAGIAYALMLKDIANEIVFIDVNDNMVNAEMLDIRHGIPHMGRAKITCGSYSDIKGSDLIVITAGRSRNSNESRLDLAGDNVKIAESIAKNIEKHYTKGVVLIVSNPVDVITYYLTKRLNLEKGKVFGTGCILDSSRLVNVISDYVNLGPEFINTFIAGEHGNTQIPVWSRSEAAQMPLGEYCKAICIPFSDEEKNIMEQKVLKMGTEIISGKGKTFYGIATCVCYLSEAILNNRTVSASVTSVLNGEYGLKDVSLSLPSLIDARGVKLILPAMLDGIEQKRLEKSAEAVKNIINSTCGTI